MEEVEESVDDCTTSHRFQPRAALCLLAASSSGTVFSRVCDPWTAGCCNAAASCPNEYEASIVVRKKEGRSLPFFLPSFVGRVCVAKSYGWLTRLHLRIWTFSGSHRCFVAGRWNAWLGSGVPSELAASAGSALACVYAGSLRTAASLRSAPEPPSRCLRRG